MTEEYDRPLDPDFLTAYPSFPTGRAATISELQTIAGWLGKHPDMYALLLWCGQAEISLEFGARFEPRTLSQIQNLDETRDRIRRWIAAAVVEPCIGCLYPVVRFPGDTEVSWPEMVRHECEPLKAPPPVPTSRQGTIRGLSR